MDPSLGISDKILSNEDKKPQAKHLQLRAEYLLRILKKKLAAAAKPVSSVLLLLFFLFYLYLLKCSNIELECYFH
jgi:hypothetical protein